MVESTFMKLVQNCGKKNHLLFLTLGPTGNGHSLLGVKNHEEKLFQKVQKMVRNIL